MATRNKAQRRSGLQDRKTEEWLVGLRIGLALAEEASEILRRGGQIDVLDEEGKVIFSSPLRDLPALRRSLESPRMKGDARAETR